MFIPLSGNLAQIFGRRPIILGGIVMFAVGSAVCGSAKTLIVLIVGRGESDNDLWQTLNKDWSDITYSSFISKAIQGVGAGTIQALSSIIITDLVPLRERGVYAGITGVYVSHSGSLLVQWYWRHLQDLDDRLCHWTLFSWRAVRKGDVEMVILWVNSVYGVVELVFIPECRHQSPAMWTRFLRCCGIPTSEETRREVSG